MEYLSKYSVSGQHNSLRETQGFMILVGNSTPKDSTSNPAELNHFQIIKSKLILFVLYDVLLLLYNRGTKCIVRGGA